MKKTVLRVYDRNDKYANHHECYFLILPDNFDIDNDYEYEEYIFANLVRIADMGWQTYTSWMIGTADIEESEMFWSEIAHYELKECKIELSRVTVNGKYKLPEMITG